MLTASLLNTLYPAGDHHLWIVLAFSNPLKMAIGLFFPWTFAQDNSSTSASALIPFCLPCDLAHILNLSLCPGSFAFTCIQTNVSTCQQFFPHHYFYFSGVSSLMFLFFLHLQKPVSWILWLINDLLLLYNIAFAFQCFTASVPWVEDDLFAVTAMFAVWISSLLPTCNSLLPQLLWHSSVSVTCIVLFCPNLPVPSPSPLYQLYEGSLESFIIKSLLPFVYWHKIKSSLHAMIWSWLLSDFSSCCFGISMLQSLWPSLCSKSHTWPFLHVA